MQALASHQPPFTLLLFTTALFLLYKKESLFLTHPKHRYGALPPGCKGLQNVSKEIIQECIDPGVNPFEQSKKNERG